MNTIKEKLTPLPWGRLSFVLLLIASGALLLIFPEKSLTWAVRIIAGVIIILALSQLILTLSKKTRGFILFLELAVTAIAGAAAGFMLYTPERAFEYLAICVGVGLMLDGAFKLQISIHSRHFRSYLWWVVLVLAIAAVVGGFLLIRFPVTVENARHAAIFIGCFLIVDGIENLITAFFRTVPLFGAERRGADGLVTVQVSEQTPIVAETAELPAPGIDAPQSAEEKALPPSDAAEKLPSVSE